MILLLYRDFHHTISPHQCQYWKSLDPDLHGVPKVGRGDHVTSWRGCISSMSAGFHVPLCWPHTFQLVKKEGRAGRRGSTQRTPSTQWPLICLDPIPLLRFCVASECCELIGHCKFKQPLNYTLLSEGFLRHITSTKAHFEKVLKILKQVWLEKCLISQNAADRGLYDPFLNTEIFAQKYQQRKSKYCGYFSINRHRNAFCRTENPNSWKQVPKQSFWKVSPFWCHINEQNTHVLLISRCCTVWAAYVV